MNKQIEEKLYCRYEFDEEELEALVKAVEQNAFKQKAEAEMLIADLQLQLEELQDAILKYGAHLSDCNIEAENECSCGYFELDVEIRARGEVK